MKSNVLEFGVMLMIIFFVSARFVKANTSRDVYQNLILCESIGRQKGLKLDKVSMGACIVLKSQLAEPKYQNSNLIAKMLSRTAIKLYHRSLAIEHIDQDIAATLRQFSEEVSYLTIEARKSYLSFLKAKAF